MHYVPRALAQTIRRAMSTFPAVLITGARQTGKTTLLRTELVTPTATFPSNVPMFEPAPWPIR